MLKSLLEYKRISKYNSDEEQKHHHKCFNKLKLQEKHVLIFYKLWARPPVKNFSSVRQVNNSTFAWPYKTARALVNVSLTFL